MRALIEASGSVVSSHSYGARKLAFEIEHATEAEYDLIQFEGSPALLEQSLSRRSPHPPDSGPCGAHL